MFVNQPLVKSQENMVLKSKIRETGEFNMTTKSYAKKANKIYHNNTLVNTQTSSLSDDAKEVLLKQSEKFGFLLQQMSTTLGLLTTLYNKMLN